MAVAARAAEMSMAITVSVAWSFEMAVQDLSELCPNRDCKDSCMRRLAVYGVKRFLRGAYSGALYAQAKVDGRR